MRDTPIENDLLRDFERLSPAMTVAEARQQLDQRPRSERYGVIVNDAGAPLACLRRLTLDELPDDQTLAAMWEHWPALLTLAEAEAISTGAVAWFFEDELFDREDLPGIILVDETGRHTAILRRRVLLEALAGGTETRYASPKGLVEEPRVHSERDLMVTRYGRLQFPAQAPLQQRCSLTVTINRELLPEAPGQVELGLTARQWPLRVVVSLVSIRSADFLVEGPDSAVIEVPRMADSTPLTFTLIPQNLGEKKIRVRFEQENTYLGTAVIATEVIKSRPAREADAEVEYPPILTAQGHPPDLTIYIEQSDRLTYTVRIRTQTDDPTTPPREIDQIEFPQLPNVYIKDIFDDLNAKTKAGLSPQEFDNEVKKIGNNLYDKLFHDDGFKAFYWEHMYPTPEVQTVQIVSDEPYIPWEILRPFRQKPDGTWESDPKYLCERFALSRWLSGPGFATKMPLLQVALVAPPSNLPYVQKEVEAIQQMPGLQVVHLIEDKPTLEAFLQTGEADVLHFACHGRFRAETPARSIIVLGNRHFQPDDLTAEYRNFGRVKPLVFLNACDSGRLGVGLTGLDGWAEAFLKANAGFFIGSVWKTTDELASQFAETFYERLLAGDPVGEAMRQARAAAKKSGDATYLSYSLYANPRVRAARPVQ